GLTDIRVVLTAAAGRRAAAAARRLPARSSRGGLNLVRRLPAPGSGRDTRRGDGGPMTRVLVVDDLDSFVHTIVQYLKVLGAACDARPRDEVRGDGADRYDAVLISPGPGTPEAAGVSVPLAHHAARRGQPLPGGCPGHPDRRSVPAGG